MRFFLAVRPVGSFFSGELLEPVAGGDVRFASATPVDYHCQGERYSERCCEYEGVVNEDFREAQDAGIQGTPGFTVNGRRLAGPQPLEAFKQVIEEEAQKAGGGTENG